MAYSVLPTIVTGQTWTAANANTYWKDNFAAGVPDIFTAAGDLAVASGADGATVLAIGSELQWPMVLSGALAYGDLSDLADYEYVDAGVNTASSSYVALTGGPSVTVTIPPSGNVLILGKATANNNTNAKFALLSVNDGSSTLSSTINGQNNTTNGQTVALLGVATGYTPGDSVTFTMYYAQADGGTASFNERFLFAIGI